jgi:hypothetical protein
MAVDQALARTLLTDAAARYESTCRWSLIVCISIFVFHILTFSPFIGAQTERAELTGQLSLLTDASAEAAAALDAQEMAMKKVRADLDAMLKNTKADFALLQRAVETIRPNLDPEASSPAAPADGSGPGPMVQMQIQSVRSAGPSPEQSARIDVFLGAIRQQGLADPVRDAKNGRQLRTVLRPIVERLVIEPQFETLRKSWREGLPDLRDKAQTARDRLARLAARFPDEPRVVAMPAEIEAYLAALDKVTFGPPDDPKWWHSVVGKDDAVLEMKDVAVELISTPSFRDARKALKALIAEQEHLTAALDGKLEDLRRQFEQQTARLGDLIAPIKGVALELSVVVANFPLVLALLLAAAMIWPARRYRALIAAAALARRAELIDQPAAEAMSGPGAWMRSAALSFGQVVLFLAWIGGAAWQVAPWEDRDGLNLNLLTGLAVLIVIGAALYRAHLMRGK